MQLCRTLPSRARIVCSAGAEGKKKSARQQRKDAVDAGQARVDRVADSIKLGGAQAEDAINNPKSTTRDTTRGASASARQGIDDTADSLKAGADQTRDAINNPRSTTGDAARSARSNVDNAADSEHL